MSKKISFSEPYNRMNMSGKRVLVTGAAGGIGQSSAYILAALGAELTLIDLKPMIETCAELDRIEAVYTCMTGDLTDDAFVDEVIGSGPFFSLAHCAGIFKAPEAMVGKEAFDFVMDVNVRAPMKLAQGCISDMVKQGGGYVVIVGSAAGMHGGIMADKNDQFYADYAASKGGIHTLIKWLARRAVVKNVLVNGVAPGMVATPMSNNGVGFDPKTMFMPLGRPAQADELGWPVAFLCTPAASFISGTVINVSGGSYVA